MPSPTVSVGLPVRNGERYLDEAIKSVLGQTYDDFTLLISDNNSTDRTREMCADWAATDPRIRYVRQDRNLGAVGNFNYVFQASDSTYFKWASHDDVCEPEFLECCVRALNERKELVWCHTDSDKIDEDGRTWRELLPPDHQDLLVHGDNVKWRGFPRDDYDSELPHKRFRGVLLGTNWCVDAYGLFRSEFLKKTQLYADCYGYEKVLLGELSLMGKYAHIPRCLFAQRIHREASSSMSTAQQQKEFAGGRFASTRLSLLRGHLTSVRKSTLSGFQRAKCYAVVLRYTLQLKKWAKVLSRTITGHGVGGESLEMLESRRSLRDHSGQRGEFDKSNRRESLK